MKTTLGFLIRERRRLLSPYLSKEENEFIAKCLKENKPLPDSYRYIIPFETKKEYEPIL